MDPAQQTRYGYTSGNLVLWIVLFGFEGTFPLSGSEYRLRLSANNARLGDFGNPRKIRDGTDKYHDGQDFSADVGTTVKAMYSGVVVRNGYQNPSDPSEGYGLRVTIHDYTLKDRTWQGRTVTYAHLDKVYDFGDHVQEGDEIGVVGTTGNSSSNDPHLHLRVQYDTGSDYPLGTDVRPSEDLPLSEQFKLGIVTEDPRLSVEGARYAKNSCKEAW